MAKTVPGEFLDRVGAWSHNGRMPCKDDILAYFSAVAHRYDLVNHVLSLNCDRRWRRRLVQRAGLRPRQRLLDLCTGTCDILVHAHHVQPKALLTGLDLTPAMLDIGRKKLNRAGASAELWTGDASAVPAPNASFDVVTMGFGLRNLEVPRQGLKEMQRLLTPGGKALILEFAPCRPNLLGHCYRCYLRHIIPHIGAWLTGSKQAYTHLCTSIQGFWGPEQMIRIMQDVGFQDVQAEPLSGKIAYLYAGTNHDA